MKKEINVIITHDVGCMFSGATHVLDYVLVQTLIPSSSRFISLPYHKGHRYKRAVSDAKASLLASEAVSGDIGSTFWTHWN